jgi:predicted RNA-binding Zn-ribbon protein involved in translation (DUF1610 family)
VTAQIVICDECGFVGPAQRQKKRGSRMLERAIWTVLFFPGIFYSLWRSSGRGIVCPKCGSKALTPFETPEGEAMLKRHLAEKK